MFIAIIITAAVLAAILLQTKPVTDSSRSLDDSFPLWKIEQDFILSKSGDASAVLKLELPEMFTLSSDDYNALHSVWLKAIRILPEGTILHKQDCFTRAKYHGDTAGSDDFLKESSDRFFEGRPFMDHTCYLVITSKAAGRRPASSAFSNLLRKSILPAKVNSAQYTRLGDVIGQFSKILSDSGYLQVSRLKADELSGSADAPGLLEQYLFLSNGGKRPELKDIMIKPDLKIGENHVQVYTLADTDTMPATCSPKVRYEKYSTDKTNFAIGFATPLGLLLPVNHIYNQYIVITDSIKTIKRLEQKRTRLQSLSMYSRENAISRDATAEYLNEAISEARQPIKAHFNLVCWTDDEGQLPEMRNKVASALSKLEAVPHLETTGAAQVWWAGLPGNEAELPENETFDTFATQASCFLNMETAYRSSDSPFGIRLGDRLTGVPLHVDISDEPMKRGISTNRNKLVVGGSGSGKSMFMNHMLYSYIQQGAHCIVVDVGHSYEGLCQLVNGYYFTYSEENPIRFNPFFIGTSDSLDTEKKESIKTLLVALWKHGDESFRRSEYVAISNALQSYYIQLEDNPALFPCFNTFYEFLQDKFRSELERDSVKDRDFDIHNFLYVLRPYYKGGEFDYLLNATENLDTLQQRFIVFEIDAIAGHPTLFPVVTLIIMEMFISKMRKLKGVRKVICIEEAWKAIANSGMAEFMRYLSKTVRKYFGETITVSQEIDDMLNSPIIKDAIINNADCKILLDLKKFQNKFEAIQAVMGMSEKGKEQVLSLNRANEPGRRYREIYIELGNQVQKVYRYEPSPEEYYAFSTEQTEKLKVQQYTEQLGDIRKALRALAV